VLVEKHRIIDGSQQKGIDRKAESAESFGIMQSVLLGYLKIRMQ
jgi:hypothetical protein